MREDAKDIIFTDDLVIENGDFLVDPSDGQHVEHIMRADRGQYRQWPLVGVGLQKAKSSSLRPQELKQEIKLQMRGDNMTVKTLKISPGDEMRISIETKRVR